MGTEAFFHTKRLHYNRLHELTILSLSQETTKVENITTKQQHTQSQQTRKEPRTGSKLQASWTV